MINVLIVDDHPVVRDGLVAILERQADITIVGEAGSGPEAVAKARETKPDIVLMDLQLPGFSGAVATHEIRAALPVTRVIVLTAYDTDEGILEAVKAGASGYLLKGTPKAELIQAIRVVAVGGSLLQPDQMARIFEKAHGPAPDPNELTEREREVLELMTDGLRNKEIGDILGITERTVKFHSGVIFQKLSVSGRSEAIAVALKTGLIK